MRRTGADLRLKLSQQAAILIAVPLVFEIVFVASLQWLLSAAEAENKAQLRAKGIVAGCNELSGLCQMGAIMLYYFSATHNPYPEGQWLEIRQGIPRAVESIRELSKSDPSIHIQVLHMENSVNQSMDVMNGYYDYIKTEDDSLRGGKLFDAKHRTLKTASEMIRSVHELAETQTTIAKRSGLEEQLRKYIRYLLLGGVTFNIGLAIAMHQFFYRGTMQRMSILMENSGRLAHGLELNPELGGSDELGRLDHVFHDMATSLREAQRKERAVIDYAVDVICSLDQDWNFTAINPAATRILGYEQDVLKGTCALALVEDAERERTKAQLDAITGGAPQSFECRLKHENGALVDVLWSAFWSDAESSMFCVLHDISDRKEVDRLKQEFVQMISHDLRTPLMSVQADLSLLSAGASGELPQKAMRNVTDAERNVEYVISLINSLLDIERMTSGKLDLHLAPTPLHTVVKRSLEAVQALAIRNKLRIEDDIPELAVVADETRLLQVIVNLLSNAIKYSNAEGTVTVRATELPNSVEVRIIDHGRGIPEEQLDKVFERFHQVEKADATVRGGTGLGLAICKAIIEAHHGEIGVMSEFGSGSEFWFCIPKVHAPVAPGSAVAGSADVPVRPDAR